MPFGNPDNSVPTIQNPPEPAWAPTDLGALLVGWYDATDSDNYTLGVGGVSQLDDLSGLSNHWTQGTDADMPDIEAAQQNSLDVVDFASGAGEFMTMTTPTELSTKEIGIFMYIKNDVTGANSFFFRAVRSTGAFGLRFFNSTPDKIQAETLGLGNVDISSSGLQSAAIIGAHQIDNGGGGSDELKHYWNTTTASTATGTLGSWGTASSFNLGQNGSGGALYDGDIGEIIITHGDVSSDAAQIITYLNDKWAVF